MKNGQRQSLEVDNRVMYLIDSYAALYAFDFDLEQGSITSRRALIEVPAAEGLMDGMTVDEDPWRALTLEAEGNR